jgi:hypothetical protein
LVKACHGSVVDDRSAAALDHLRNHGPGELHHSFDVDLPAQIPVLAQNIEEGSYPDRGSGVVEQDVDTAKGLAGLFDAGPDRIGIGHVHRHAQPLGAKGFDLGDQPLEGPGFVSDAEQPFDHQILALSGEIRDHHARPLLSQLERARPAHALGASRTRDDGDLSFQQFHVCSPAFSSGYLEAIPRLRCTPRRRPRHPAESSPELL